MSVKLKLLNQKVQLTVKTPIEHGKNRKMAINFRKRASAFGLNSSKDPTFRQKLNSVVEHLFPDIDRLKTNQVERIRQEILDSGLVNETSQITTDIIRDYCVLKHHFPRVRFCKEFLDKSNELLRRFDSDTLTAEQIYLLLHEVDNCISDSAIYYWFQRIGSQFSTTSNYSKKVCAKVLYAAIARRERLGRTTVI